MLSIIVASLFVSLLLNLFLKNMHLPTIIGYIFTGTIIAYGFELHDAVHNQDLRELAEFGVVFLMFTIGLEFSIRQLKQMRYEVFIAGSLQIVMTTLVVYLLSVTLFQFNQKTSLVFGLVIALSSTAIVLKTFNETGEITRRYGQRTLGILIMQDIAVVPILLLISLLSNTDNDLNHVIIEILISGTVLLFSLWVIGKYLLDPLFEAISNTRSEELFMGTILFLAIGASYLAHKLGFSYSLGAFIAGMLIAETRYKYQAEADLIPFRDLLLGVFFVTVGMQIDFAVILSYLLVIVGLLMGVMVLKFSITYMIVRRKESQRTSFKTALSLVQIGEFSLALLELARTHQLIEAPYGQVMIVTVVLSMIMTPFILKNLTSWSAKIMPSHQSIEEPEIMTDLYRDHVVILGFGEFGQNVARILKARGEQYLAIENKILTVLEQQKIGEPVRFGNAAKKEILKKVEVQKAKKIIVAIDNPKKMYQVCDVLIQSVTVDKIIVKVHSEVEKAYINDLKITNLVIENQITSQYIVDLLA